MGFIDRLKEGLSKTKKNFTEKVESLLKSFKQIDDDLFEELEEVLVLSDVGVKTSQKIIENLKERVKKERILDPQVVKELLKEEMLNIINLENKLSEKYPLIILMVGVNGVGKTTSIGKIANLLKSNGKKVLIAAADTFRAAAAEQLEIWAKRVGCDIIKHVEGSDPAAVVFDGIQAMRARKADVLIVDTAGRLHTKKNLIEELKKIDRVINQQMPEAAKETLLVIDATTGQNALNQAKEFNQAVNISGIVLTKLDGTAKGGIVISICDELKIPVKFVGVGEKIDDLQQFNAKEFVDALFEN
ncbi:fused signal recognition particle receptor [Caldicellulosiruptor bescii]|uniref:Signal recognition particle receptor FtsY n=2 Tax=Caldicellulosiruptor bescii TaxID=31899 RepID=B9MRG6_CALBD|nr:signal recognition particle-docking protein FtsY [Caldicellulosiruptor bescii]ACM60270.1 signal recognition particle-docking protein FtsY [Caldicellulosiruptor bescii DSM 6725]PBC87685.1 fused signal recognition particle receptor [Caldicellulosiruptor bescii]PBC90618.1 fused signal recognition particle receptor [Caldicellulosiruptor bescii]PBD03949.1 fused signal recognition particle receptor [Caldicellulosiruptor bescii]PBD06415.1 fused signal recognition particle receptor [Caldicellulosir